jgi:ribosomal protein L40E
MDEATIKHLIGHGPDSTIMESTYQHLSDDDHIEAVEVAAGLRDEEEQSPLTPDVCLTCGEQLPASARACPGCGETFAPDAKAVEEQIQEDMKESYKQVNPNDDEKMEKLEKLDELLKDPEVLELLKERLE